jgi:hypothetical protein
VAEWIYEAGIGERRAALVVDGRIVRAEVERDSDGLRPGSVRSGRIVAHDRARRRSLVQLAEGSEVWLSPAPVDRSEGSHVAVRVTRMAMAERGRVKPALAMLADSEGEVDGPDLIARVSASGLPVRQRMPGDTPDTLEEAGWGELVEAARTGHWPFAGGALAIAPTPAMTVIDVDGDLAPAPLAEAGARAVAAAITGLGISGNIGADFPTLQSRVERQAVDHALAAGLADWPHERTAMNGFGFVQIVARKTQPSLLERMQMNAAEGDALALLRLAERARGSGAMMLTARPAVVDVLTARPEWTAALAQRLGRPVTLVADAAVNGAGHAQ